MRVLAHLPSSFLLLPLLLLLQTTASQAARFGDTFCQGPLCVSGIYDDAASSVAYTAVYTGAVGWVGVGQGEQMAGANMMVGWPMPDGSVVLSQRSATSHTMPTAQAVAPAFKPDTAASSTNASMTVLSWTFPVDAATFAASAQTSHIFAACRTSPNSKDPSAPITKHNMHGDFALDFTKPLSGTLSSSSGGGAQGGMTSSATKKVALRKFRDLSQLSTRLFLAHMIVMSVAWYGFLAAGILIGRYGRTLFPSKWFRIHRGVQLAGVVLIIVGFGLGLGAVHAIGSDHFDSDHARCGLAMFILVLVQVMLGGVGHAVRHKNGNRVVNYVHMALGGVLFFGLTLYQIRSGLKLWMWRPADGWRDIFFPLWFALITAVWLGGLVFLPREMEAARKFQPRQKKEEVSQ